MARKNIRAPKRASAEAAGDDTGSVWENATPAQIGAAFDKRVEVMTPNPREVVGGNNPPEPIHTALDYLDGVLKGASAAMAEAPVIQDAETGTKLATYASQIKEALRNADNERDKRVRPLNEQVKGINDDYRGPTQQGKTLVDEINRRNTAFARAEEAKRLEALRIAEAAKAEAERLAREAEAKEAELKENADQGEIGGDVLAATQEADQRFNDYKAAERQSRFAKKEATVRVHTGQQAQSMRNVETLTVASVKDILMALREEPEFQIITDALISAGRAYRKRVGELPAGIAASYERKFV